MTAMRLSISSSMFPNFRGRLCMQRPVSCTTLSSYPALVQSLSGSAPGCRRCQPRSQRRAASKASVPAADGEWDATSFHCRSCGDADFLGTSGRKAGESVQWEVLGRESWTQALEDGGILDGLQDWNAYFLGTKRLSGSQTSNSRKSGRSNPISAVPSRLRLKISWIEHSDGFRGEMKLPAYHGYSCSSPPLYSVSQNHPDCSNSSSSCFSLPKRGLCSGADSWGMTSLPLFTSQPSARFSSRSGRSWSVPENFFMHKANFFQITTRGGPARYMYSVGVPLFDKFAASSSPPTEGEGAAGSQKFQSASSHLASPTTDHPSCAAPESSKGLAAPGLLSLGSQKVLIWGEGDIEQPADAGTRQQEELSESRSDSMNLTDEDFLGLNGIGQHEVDDQPDVLKVTKHTENSSTGATQFFSGEEAPDVESQMEAAVMKALERSLGSPLGREPQIPPPKPLVIVISGPSGVGKDVVIKKLQEQRNGIHFVVTATTRPQRPGEVDGHDYFFVSKEEFQTMIDKGELLEHAVVYGDFKGIPKQQVRDCMAKGTDVVLRVDVQGAATVRSILGSNAVFIFLLAESEASLVKRLVTRKTETLDKVVLRIATAREELKRLDEFDYAVVNAEGQLDRTVSSICSIIDAEKSRVHQRTAII